MVVLPTFRQLWNEYLDVAPDREGARERFYEACCFGRTPENASKTAGLIMRGEKTATASLLSEFELTGKPLPDVGALTIVVDGQDRAVGIIETVEVRIAPFCDVDARFVDEYGEGDRSLHFWRTMMWGYYAEECERLGVVPSEEMPLVCERFKVVYAGGSEPRAT